MREWPGRGKRYKCMIKDGSNHIQFWQDAKYLLRNMYFQRLGTQENIRPPSLKNCVITLNGVEEVFKAVRGKSVRYIRPRDFNQDPVENIFGKFVNKAFEILTRRPLCSHTILELCWSMVWPHSIPVLRTAHN